MRTFIVDARWLGRGGVGRLTELVLAGLGEIAPEGRWLLWGPERAGAYVFGNGDLIRDDRDPLRLRGFTPPALPQADAVVFLHAVRPLLRRRNVTFIHDTIPVRWATSRQRRLYWRAHFRLVARAASSVLTISRAVRRQVAADTGLREDEIGVAPVPIDPRFVAGPLEGRRRGDLGLYVGQIAPHKNCRRLVQAFARSAFAAHGGRLLFVGARDAAAVDLREFVAAERIGGVEILGRVDDDELLSLYRQAAFLAMPSFEEGFGLPAVEGALMGLPVVVSDVPVFAETIAPVYPRCDPADLASIRDALDAAASWSDAEADAARSAQVAWSPPATRQDMAGVVARAALEVARRR